MKVAIIGANGFIGTRLLETLVLNTTGHSPVAVVRRPSGLASACRFNVEWRLGDALELESLSRALAGCDAVVHAALGDARQIERMPAVLTAACARVKVKRIIYLSSASVHGQAPAPGTDENTPLQTGQAMAYNDAKVRAERSFFTTCRKHGIEGFALRPGVVYGSRSRWIADLANDLRGGRAWLYNDGSAVLNGIHIDNLCHAVLRCLTAPASATGAYLIGDPSPTTWRDFTHAVADDLGISKERIHRVTRLPVFSKDARQKLREVAAGTLVQSVLPLFPGKLKQTVKRLLEPVPTPPESWRLPSLPAPHFTEELVLLQQCTWRFPNTWATEKLGYQPPLTNAEGLRQSLAWLAFAEGRSC